MCGIEGEKERTILSETPQGGQDEKEMEGGENLGAEKQLPLSLIRLHKIFFRNFPFCEEQSWPNEEKQVEN